MKKSTVLLILINLVMIRYIYADTPEKNDSGKSSLIQEKKDKSDNTSMEWNAVLSLIPFTNWQLITLYGDKRLKYDINSKSSTYEVNMRMWPFSFGTIAATDDNISGKITRIMGYIGYEKFSVKLSSSDLKGKGYWSGPYGYDTEPSFKINDSVKTVDLLYNGEPGTGLFRDMESWYVGITYTEFTMPLQIKTYEYAWNGGGGEPFYDEKFGGRTYGIIFGFNRLKNKNKPPGWGIFVISQDRFTAGKYSLSDRAVVRAEALNPGYVIGDKRVWGTYLENETALGLSWTHNFEEGNITFAVGYDLIWGDLSAYSFGKETQPGILDWEQTTFFFRHGVIFCINGQW